MQEEIDSLTKRAKYAEQSFLTVYQKLSEAPDPVNTLSAASESQQDLARLQAENGKLKDELEEFRAEATGLKNQQVTIRRLEERNRQLEMRAEEKVCMYMRVCMSGREGHLLSLLFGREGGGETGQGANGTQGEATR